VKLTILVSGGLDSAVLLNHAIRSMPPSDITAVTVRYGQPHEKEIVFAKEICDRLGVSHQVVSAFPWHKGPIQENVNDIPWNPKAGDPMVIRGRNSLFVTLSYIVAECDEIWLGCNSDDQRDYPDCREGWAKSIGNVFGVIVRLPFCLLTKRQIVGMARDYNVDIDRTLSCYRGLVPGCGECNSCVLRAEAMKNENLSS